MSSSAFDLTSNVTEVTASPPVLDRRGTREAGLPERNLELWYGMFVPAGTPPAIVKRIYDATITAMQQASVTATLAREGAEVAVSASPEQFASFPAEDGRFWANDSLLNDFVRA